MGATTFYLLELEKKKREQLKKQDEKQVNEKNTEEQNTETDYSKLTKNEIKAILDEKGIDYDSRAKKDELIELLKRS